MATLSSILPPVNLSNAIGTLPVGSGGTGVTTSTGSGSVVLSTSPTLVTPVLGAATATSITAALGSASAPSYTFSGDTNTGIFSPAADTLAFAEGGVEAMRIDSSANVGIGTTSPSYKLDVGGFASVNTTLRVAAGSGFNATLKLMETSDSYGFTLLNSVGLAGLNILRHDNNSTGTTALFVNRTTGSVGIGTTSPSVVLDVIGAMRTGGTSAGYLFAPRNTGTGNAWVMYSQSGELSFYSYNSATFPLVVSSTGVVTSSSLADAVGYKGVPQNSQTATYTLALADMGKHISITTGGVVIPANASVAFPIGSAVTIFNNSGSNQTISITTDTLRQAGTANTGSRTLAQYGVATVLKVTSTVWVITGNVT